MKKSLHIVVYREGLRYVVGDATVEVDENMEIDWKKAEINITNPEITEMIEGPATGYSLGPKKIQVNITPPADKTPIIIDRRPRKD